MLKIYFISMIALMASALGLSAQVVTATPSPLMEDSQNVVVYFHADEGNKGLMGQPSTAALYAYTGVDIIDANGKVGNWQYVVAAWDTNTDKCKLEYVSENLWKLNIGNLHDFYGVPSTETITRLCFVFRSSGGEPTGRGEGDADIYLAVENSLSWESQPSTLTEAPAMGATRNSDGTVTFCLAAPGKQNVMIVGSWNDYTLTGDQMMSYIDQDVDGTTCRFFTITLPESQVPRNENTIYYYLVDNSVAVCDPYARLALDPSNDKYIPEDVYPDLPAYPDSKVTTTPVAVFADNLLDYTWQTSDFSAPAKIDLIVYELLLRDFTGTEGEALGNGTVRQAIERIPYLKSLGINAVELLPINEFNGNISWGYNPNLYFAIDKAYGTPQDYKEFIDKCHAEGIAVILDMVFNQSDGLHPWYMMYTPAENPFYNLNAPHAYSVLNDWNQGYPLVNQQWKDVLQFWLGEYKVDGFRFDLVKGLGDNDSYTSSEDAATDAYNQSRIDRMKKLHGYVKEINANAYCINENLATASEENQMAADGELNWANVNEAGCQFAMGYSDDSNLNRMWATQDNRTAGSTISYLESHDEQRLAYKQDQWGVSGVKGVASASCQRLGSAAAQMILVPGSHMIWQFSEMGNAQNTKTDQGNNTDPKIVNWDLLNDPDHKGLFESYQQLIALRLNNKDLFTPAQGVDFAMQCTASNWTNGRTLIARSSDKELYCAINPNTSGVLSVPVAFRTADSSAYEIYSQSYGASGSFSAETGVIDVPANCYVVVCSRTVSTVNELDADFSDNMSITSGKGTLSIRNASAPVYVYDLAGSLYYTGIGTDVTIALPAGIYVVRSGAESSKHLVK